MIQLPSEVERRFWEALTAEECALVESLETPLKIQAYLDSIPYARLGNRSPLNVIRERKAHCLDGALFAAAMLRMHGYPPLMMDLIPEPERDDDHVLALYRVNGRWGCLAKSNFVGIRARQPVYLTRRELAMSYFETYYNVEREYTLRGYSRLVDLRAWDRLNWMLDDAGIDEIERRIPRLPHTITVPPEIAASLPLVDERTYAANLLGADPAGLYRPGEVNL